MPTKRIILRKSKYEDKSLPALLDNPNKNVVSGFKDHPSSHSMRQPRPMTTYKIKELEPTYHRLSSAAHSKVRSAQHSPRSSSR